MLLSHHLLEELFLNHKNFQPKSRSLLALHTDTEQAWLIVKGGCITTFVSPEARQGEDAAQAVSSGTIEFERIMNCLRNSLNVT